VTDQEALELAIIENVQRADLNPIEEAMGYEQLTAEFSYSQGELAKVIGKSRSHVANTMRLLKLPNSVKDYLAEGLLTAGHARALITVDDPAALGRADRRKRPDRARRGKDLAGSGGPCQAEGRQGSDCETGEGCRYEVAGKATDRYPRDSRSPSATSPARNPAT
jgi:ParB-like chromosome segregation protein Spo0J